MTKRRNNRRNPALPINGAKLKRALAQEQPQRKVTPALPTAKPQVKR
jgi:hypothetical protein